MFNKMVDCKTKDGTCPFCEVILNVYWHYGLDGIPWCWCQKCHNFVQLEVIYNGEIH